jgi:hypothetical protein
MDIRDRVSKLEARISKLETHLQRLASMADPNLQPVKRVMLAGSEHSDQILSGNSLMAVPPPPKMKGSTLRPYRSGRGRGLQNGVESPWKF